jgi:hypothetical protein
LETYELACSLSHHGGRPFASATFAGLFEDDAM